MPVNGRPIAGQVSGQAYVLIEDWLTDPEILAVLNDRGIATPEQLDRVLRADGWDVYDALKYAIALLNVGQIRGIVIRHVREATKATELAADAIVSTTRRVLGRELLMTIN